MLGDSGWETCGWYRLSVAVKSQNAGLAGSGISRQRDRGDVKPGKQVLCCHLSAVSLERAVWLTQEGIFGLKVRKFVWRD